MSTLGDRQEMVNKIISALCPGAKSRSPASSHPLLWPVCLHSVKHSRTDQTMCILPCLKCWLMTDLVTKAWQILYHTQRDGRAALLGSQGLSVPAKQWEVEEAGLDQLWHWHTPCIQTQTNLGWKQQWHRSARHSSALITRAGLSALFPLPIPSMDWGSDLWPLGFLAITYHWPINPGHLQQCCRNRDLNKGGMQLNGCLVSREDNRSKFCKAGTQ